MSKSKLKKVAQDATMYKPCDCEPMFAGVKTNEGIIICLGKFRVSSKTFKTYEEVETYVASKPYEILINVAVLMTKLNDNENETKNENPQDK